MFEIVEKDANLGAKIKVIGVGGGGTNAVATMINLGLSGVDFIAANTDNQALHNHPASNRIQLAGAQSTAATSPPLRRHKHRSAATYIRCRTTSRSRATWASVPSDAGGRDPKARACVPAIAARTLRWLDVYEGIVPGRDAHTEYERLLCDVMLDDGQGRRAWIYVYRGVMAAATHIPESRWLRTRVDP